MNEVADRATRAEVERLSRVVSSGLTNLTQSNLDAIATSGDIAKSIADWEFDWVTLL